MEVQEKIQNIQGQIEDAETCQMGGPGESGGAEVAGEGPVARHVRGLQVDPEGVC